MRYRPFGPAGVTVSTVTLAVDEVAADRGEQALRELIWAGLEAGVNAYHLETADTSALRAAGNALSTVDRRLLFVSLRLGHRLTRTGLVRDFSAEALIENVDQALDALALDRIDLVMLDEPAEDELPTAALAALKDARADGRVAMIGVAGADAAMDVYLNTRAFNAIATPFNPQVGWPERNRVKAAERLDIAAIGYDFFPDALRALAAAPEPARKRGLFGFGGGSASAAPSVAGAWAFLRETPGWSAEELCLAYAQMEPALASVLIRPADPDHLIALAAVADRDLPAGLAAQIEMAGCGDSPAREARSGA